MIDPAKYPTLASVLITAAPEIKTLKKNKVKLTDEERTAVMKAGAVWHHGPNGEETPAIQKADVKGKTWYWCGTHRAYDCAPTLKGAIKAFEFIKTTAGVLDEVLGRRAPTDQELRDTLEMMRDMGLVPTGKGKPTRPKGHPDFYVVADSKEKIYYLVTMEGNDKGRWWIIYPEGGNKPLGEFEGQWHKLSGQTVYDEGEWRDYVPLAVIQEVYGLIDPEFNKPRPGEEEFSG